MATPRIRKNIDSLTPQGHVDYEHAVSGCWRSRSRIRTASTGTRLEQLHDGELGPCEHANNTYMPWHRAHLFLFEEALRRSDPPRTENVTVPYWDWSALPSGSRFPKAFENTGSVLFHDFPQRHARSAALPAATHVNSCRSRAAHLDAPACSASLKWSTADGRAVGGFDSFGGHEGGGAGLLVAVRRRVRSARAAWPQHDARLLRRRRHGGSLRSPCSIRSSTPSIATSDLLWAQWQERVRDRHGPRRAPVRAVQGPRAPPGESLPGKGHSRHRGAARVRVRVHPGAAAATPQSVPGGRCGQFSPRTQRSTSSSAPASGRRSCARWT